MKYILESIAIAVVLTALSYGVGLYLGWIVALDWLEVFAVFTSYSCTWLCTRQSRWNYPIGVITTAAYSVLFWQWAMPALAIFNLYLVGSLIYGWFRWGSDDNTRPVTRVPLKWYAGYGAIGLVILGLFLLANLMINPAGITALNPIDVSLAVMSGVAQLMLDNKKLETWSLWAMVNIVSIPFFLCAGLAALTFSNLSLPLIVAIVSNPISWQGGLTLVAFQYIFFLANTYIGHTQWRKTMVETKVAA
jgi:nicotinamide mononucleotide transporter